MMNLNKFLASAMALSMVATTLPASATDVEDRLDTIADLIELADSTEDTTEEEATEEDATEEEATEEDATEEEATEEDATEEEATEEDATEEDASEEDATEEESDLLLDEQEFQSPETTTETTFQDVSGHWGEYFVVTAVEKGLFAGKTANTFDPDAMITRAEFIVPMMGLLGATPTEGLEGPWYAGFFDVAESMDLVPESFTIDNLGEAITREEIACVLIKTLVATGTTDYDLENTQAGDLTDMDQVGEYYAAYVNLALEEGLMSGNDNGTFAPSNNASRVEAATVSVQISDKFFGEEAPEADDTTEEEAPEADDTTDEAPEADDTTDEAPEADDTTDEEAESDDATEEEAEDDTVYDNDLSKSFAAAIVSARNDEANSAFPIFASTTVEMWEMVSPALGITEDQIEAFAMGTSMMATHAYGVIVVKPVEGELTNIMAGLETFQANQESTFEQYLADQYEIAQNTVIVTTSDDTIVFVMSEDAKEIADSIVATLSFS